MERIPVSSSQITSIGYDPVTRKLEIEFVQHNPAKLPSIYLYSNVTAKDHADLMSAESIGRHFRINIKEEPEQFPYIKVQ